MWPFLDILEYQSSCTHDALGGARQGWYRNSYTPKTWGDAAVSRAHIEEADMAAWLASSRFKPVRLELTLGDIFFMTDDTVHTGDHGMDGQPSPRVHWYMTEGDKWASVVLRSCASVLRLELSD